MFIFDLTAQFGRVQMTGATRLDFLHRMSTNDMLVLPAGRGRVTALTTPIGRMVDAPAVVAMDDALILLTGSGNAGHVTAWLRKYVLYNDQVTVHDITQMTRMIGVYGEGADAWVRDFEADAFQALQSAPVYSSTQLGGNLLIKAPALAGTGYFLLGARLPKLNAEFDAPAKYEAMRIAAGYPMAPHEINEDYIPLETGLWDAVNFNKGCYIGQEIIARMESRGQMAKKLVRLDVADAVAIIPGTELFVDGNAIGKVTSASAPWALGYVRTAQAQSGQVCQTAAGDAVRVVNIVGASEPLDAQN